MTSLDSVRATLQRLVRWLTKTAALLLSLGLCVAVGGLLALSYRSLYNWRRSSEMLAG